MFGTNENGEVLCYVKRNAWGNPKVPIQDDANLLGVEESLRFTNYRYDPVIDKYFAHARFYDANSGRMLEKDPVKNGFNGYVYCRNNPNNYVDPTGEIPFLLAAAGLGGALGFLESTVSQIVSGEDYDLKEALGAAAKGTMEGIGKGLTLGVPGMSLIPAAGVNLLMSTLGDSLDQWITTGEVDVKKALTYGTSNAVSNMIYGDAPFDSMKKAFKKGAQAGASSAAITDLFSLWDTDEEKDDKNPTFSDINPYKVGGDPKTSCSSTDVCANVVCSTAGYGYENQKKSQGNKKFSLVDFGKDIALGAASEALFSTSLCKVFKGTKSSSNSNGSMSSKGGSDVLANNRVKGVLFENQEFAKFGNKYNNAAEQITIKTPSGTRTRVDAIGIDGNKNVVINEFKSSSTAPLTKNQKIAFPEIYNSGGTVAGKGKGIFTKGYQIPAGTEVRIVRP